MLVTAPQTFTHVGASARLLVAKAAMQNPHLRSDAELAEDCRLVLGHCTDRGLVDRALMLQMALAVSPPHTPQKDIAG